MSETPEKTWIVGPNGAEICVLIGVEIDQVTFDKRVAAGDFTVIAAPGKAPKKAPAKAADAEDAE